MQRMYKVSTRNRHYYSSDNNLNTLNLGCFGPLVREDSRNLSATRITVAVESTGSSRLGARGNLAPGYNADLSLAR